MLLIIALWSILALCQGAVPSKENCNDLSLKNVPDFSWDKFLGTWYITYRTYSDLHSGETCSRYILTQEEDGTIMSNESVVNGTGVMVNYTGPVIPPTDSKYVYAITLPLPQFRNRNFTANWAVLSANWNESVLIFDCSISNVAKQGLSIETVFVLSKTPEVKSSDLTNAKEVLEKNGISTAYAIAAVPHNNCTY